MGCGTSNAQSAEADRKAPVSRGPGPVPVSGSSPPPEQDGPRQSRPPDRASGSCGRPLVTPQPPDSPTSGGPDTAATAGGPSPGMSPVASPAARTQPPGGFAADPAGTPQPPPQAHGASFALDSVASTAEKPLPLSSPSNAERIGDTPDCFDSTGVSTTGALSASEHQLSPVTSGAAHRRESMRRRSSACLERKGSHVLETRSVVKGEDAEGNKMINEYSVIAELGRGSYGKVKLVVHNSTDRNYAIKIMNKSVLSRVKKDATGGKTALDDVLQEIAIMKRLDHPNVVKMHEVINDPECNKLYLIVDYVERGPVFKIGSEAQPMAVYEVRRCAIDICRGLNYLHQLNIIHRDIKPENILVDGAGVCRLTDFGVSNQFDDIAEDDNIDVVDTQGTPAFITPEQVREEAIPGPLTDLWALGVTLYVMATAELPFRGESFKEMAHSITHSEPDWQPLEGPEAQALLGLLQGLLHKNRERRIGNQGGVQEVQQHEFIGDTTSQTYSRIEVTEAEREAAVTTGHNIQLKVMMAARTMMRVETFRRRTLQSIKREDSDLSGQQRSGSVRSERSQQTASSSPRVKASGDGRLQQRELSGILQVEQEAAAEED